MNLLAQATAFATAVATATNSYFHPCGNLATDGYCLLSSRNTLNSLAAVVLSQLPAGYHFLDYKYTIPGQPLVTYHRDVTSSQTSFNTTHPTYTVIHYNYAGDHLSVAVGSHLRWTTWLPSSLGGAKDTVVLFNADLVHAGLAAPDGVQRIATQYKVAHLDDFYKLQHLQDISVTQASTRVEEPLSSLLRVLSYVFTVPIQVFARRLLQDRQPGFLGFLQSLFPLQYFNKV